MSYKNEPESDVTDLVGEFISRGVCGLSNKQETVICLLLGMEHFTECISLVKEQKLYIHALDLFAIDSQQYKVCGLSSQFSQHATALPE